MLIEYDLQDSSVIVSTDLNLSTMFVSTSTNVTTITRADEEPVKTLPDRTTVNVITDFRFGSSYGSSFLPMY